MKKSVCLIGCVLGALLVGCTPDKVTVTIPTSAIRKASSGEIEYVKVKATFSDASSEETLNKVRRVALRHLGEGAEIEIDQEGSSFKLTALFKIPFGEASALANAPKSILVLSTDASGRIELRNGPGLRFLNFDLNEIGSDVKAEFNGGETLFRFVGTDETATQINVIAAFTNNKPTTTVVATIEKNEEIVVRFNRNSGSVWNSLDPFVILR